MSAGDQKTAREGLEPKSPVPAPERGSIARAASVAGRAHRRLGKNNQDAAAVSHGDGFTVAVVCDGCSSGAASEVGAKLGARFLATQVPGLARQVGLSLALAERVADALVEYLAVVALGMSSEVGRLAPTLGGRSARSSLSQGPLTEQQTAQQVTAAPFDGASGCVGPRRAVESVQASTDRVRSGGGASAPNAGSVVTAMTEEPSFATGVQRLREGGSLPERGSNLSASTGRLEWEADDARLTGAASAGATGLASLSEPQAARGRPDGLGTPPAQNAQAALRCLHDALFSDAVASQLLFTFLCAVTDGAQALVFGVGDGVVVVDGAMRVIDPGPENAPPYLAYRLLELTRANALEPVIYHCGPAQTVAIATDGFVSALAELPSLLGDKVVHKNPVHLQRRLNVLTEHSSTYADDVSVALLWLSPKTEEAGR